VKFTAIDAPQRSPEWFAARIGRVTGSCADKMLTKGKGSAESVTKRDLRIRLALERVGGVSLDQGGYVSSEMQRGTELEPVARLAYEAYTGVLEIRQTGFLRVDDLMIGCSLDGDIDDFHTLVSFKCPKSANHMEYARLADGEVPKDYAGQIMHELLITGAKEYHFVSFDDRFTGRAEHLQLVVRKFRREQFDLAGYEKALREFLAEVEREVETILTLGTLKSTLQAVVGASA
jgi:predicted phage-related endonuclease